MLDLLRAATPPSVAILSLNSQSLKLALAKSVVTMTPPIASDGVRAR